MADKKKSENSHRLREAAEAQIRKRERAKPKSMTKADADALIHELQVHQIELEMQNEELKAARLITEETLEEYSTHYEFAPSGHFTVDRKGVISESNLNGAKMLGKDRSKLIGCTFTQFIQLEMHNIFHDFLHKVFTKGEQVSCEVSLNPKIVPNKFVHIDGLKIANKQKCLLIAADITEFKLVQDELLDHRNRLQTMVEELKLTYGRLVESQKLAHIGTWEFIPDTEEITWTEELCSIFGLNVANPPSNYSGFRVMLTQESSTAFDRAVKYVMAKGEQDELELEILRPAGDHRNIFAKIAPVLNGSKKIVKLQAIMQDITVRKALEIQNRRAQRMEILGTLASGIAHDLRNILTPVSVSLETLRTKYANDKNAVRLFKTLESTVNRGTGVVKQILSFARGKELQREVVDVGSELSDMKRIIEETFPKNITARLAIAKDVPRILADKTQFRQVLMNLCINARDALPNGGRLSLAAKLAGIDKQYAALAGEVKPGKYVAIQVSDTGTGIDKKLVEKIFDPFFTTNEANGGTGLGLSIVQGIVKGHDGFIEVESEVNKGTTFNVYLPFASGEEDLDTVEQEKTLRRGSGEKILIVEDEPIIAEVTKSTLETYGYKVLAASDGSEAVALFAQYSDDVSLVLTDIVMPVMDGAATIQALRKLKPKIKIIVATGHTDDVNNHAPIGAVDAILKKPYTAKKLVNTIAEVLESTK